MGASRAIAVTLITLVAICIFVIMALLVIPTLVNQTANLINIAPQLFSDLQNFLTTRFPDLVDQDSTLRQSLATVGTTIQERGGQLVETVLSSVGSLVNIVVLLVIVPVVAFYLLYD